MFGNKEMRILILGLDGTLKTIQTPHTPKVQERQPFYTSCSVVKSSQQSPVGAKAGSLTATAIGFNVETVTYKNIKFQGIPNSPELDFNSIQCGILVDRRASGR